MKAASFKEWLGRFGNELKTYFNVINDLEPQDDAELSVRSGVSFKGSQLLMLIFAIFIASLGLNTNSIPVIIGAMLISPLMGPIIGMGVAIAIEDYTLLRTGLKNISMAVLADTLATSYALATAIKKIGGADIIIGGRQAIDGDTAQVGPQVAQKLGLSQVTYAEEIEKCEDGKLTIRRHIDGGVETVEAPMPIVITVNGSAAPCRPCNAKLVMKYKRATVPLERTEATAYDRLYDERPYLTLNQWSVADVDGDVQQCGLSGSPTKVKAVKNIVFQAKESKSLTGSDTDIEELVKELLNEKIIG